MAAGWAGERSDRHGFLRFGGVSGRTGMRHDRVAQLLGAWYEESSKATGHGYADWFVPATTEVVEILLALEDLDAALVSLGAARAHHGYTQIDALTDLAVLADVAPGRLRYRAEMPEASAALIAGFESVDSASFAPAPPIFGREALADAVSSDERHDAARRRAETFAAIVADVSGAEPGAEAPGVAVHVTAAEIELHLPLADQLFWLRGGRFAVLVWRHPGLAQTVVQLERALSARSELEAVDANVWIEVVADAMVDPAAWVDRLAEVAPPKRDARDLRLATLLVDTPRSVEPIEQKPGARLLAGAQDLWKQSASLVAAALTVVVVAAGLARAMGPLESGGNDDTVTFESAAGPVLEEDTSTDSSTTVVTAPVVPVRGEVVEQPPPVPVSPQPVSHVEDAPPAPSNPPAPAPRPQVEPEPQPAPQPEPQPQAEPQPAPPPDPCAGLEKGEAVACERHQEVEPRGQEKHENGSPGREAPGNAKA